MVHAATHEDIPRLIEMMEEFYAEGHFELDHAEATKSFRTLLENEPFGAIWMSFDGDQAVGYVVLTVRFSMEFGGFDGCIDDLYVRPAARRKGFAHELIEALLIECHDRDLESLHVEVAPDNIPARHLYNRAGLQLRDDKRDTMVARLKGTF